MADEKKEAPTLGWLARYERERQQRAQLKRVLIGIGGVVGLVAGVSIYDSIERRRERERRQQRNGELRERERREAAERERPALEERQRQEAEQRRLAAAEAEERRHEEREREEERRRRVDDALDRATAELNASIDEDEEVTL